MDFVHLHTHTAYSLLDGQGTTEKILNRAKELGQTAMAITDHGNMYGVIEFYEYAKKIGIKPILGCEVYLAARSMYDKVYELDRERFHLILLAENDTGYKNLMKIVSAGFIDGFYFKPRVDMNLLRQHSEGIIALSGCMFGPLSRRILGGNYEGAVKWAKELTDIFGRDNFYVEIQDHGLYEQKRLNSGLIKLARELDLSLVATNDIHYVRKRDAEFQDLLMCIQTGKTVGDTDRMKMDSSELYVKSSQEMEALFGHIPEALENTIKIAERCNVEIEFGKLHLPKFEVPTGQPAEEYLRDLCMEGFHFRYPNDKADESSGVFRRLLYELDTIKSMGYVDYFLIVWDFIKYARDNGIMVGPGRGSAAGSIVAYCLHITNVDPIKYDLIFERFLNPERISMPDIDVDFCYERRQEVIDYVNKKYGSDRVCQIITFGTMAARQAVRDVGRALDMPYATVDAVAKQIPFVLHMTLDKALVMNPRLKKMYTDDSAVKKLIDSAKELEGLPRHASTHAAGVVITRDPVVSYVPLQKNDDVITTQFPMTTIERLGLLKMDFLGLRTLTVIQDAVKSIYKNHKIKIDLDHMTFDDREVYNMISAGRSDGVFQLESAGMKRFMTELKPSSLEDIIAGISLYRPGPMDSIPTYIKNKQDPKNIKYKHPLLEPILKVTYGCIVYQEQVMQIVRELGGYSSGRADLVRRAMSKKKADVMAKERGAFLEGAAERGISGEVAGSIFDEMMDFASYAFNKSHAAAYAVLAYQTAFLKCHYPAEFFSAMLNSFIDNSDKVSKYILIAKDEGIRIIPPDINISGSRFGAEKAGIVFGLGAIKNVGEGVMAQIEEERKRGGKFRSFTDFCRRMANKRINKRAVESLIYCGVFDSLGLKRSVLLYEYEGVMERVAESSKKEFRGQISLFDMEDAPDTGARDIDNFEDRPELSKALMLAKEKECIGMYVSGHPLDDFRDMQFSREITPIMNVVDDEEGLYGPDTPVTMIGIVSEVRLRRTKRNAVMKYMTLEDLTGSIECIVFPTGVDSYDSLLEKDRLVEIRGDLDITENQPPKVRVRTIEALRRRNKPKLYICLNTRDNEKLDAIKNTLKGAKGSAEIYVYFADEKKTSKARSTIDLSDSRIRTLENILGKENIKSVRK